MVVHSDNGAEAHVPANRDRGRRRHDGVDGRGRAWNRQSERRKMEAEGGGRVGWVADPAGEGVVDWNRPGRGNCKYLRDFVYST
jgi:hypothetical protein